MNTPRLPKHNKQLLLQLTSAITAVVVTAPGPVITDRAAPDPTGRFGPGLDQQEQEHNNDCQGRGCQVFVPDTLGPFSPALCLQPINDQDNVAHKKYCSDQANNDHLSDSQ
jgi:hypothetical protein